MALIELEQMEFYAFHGCYKAESIVGTRFLVNIKFETNTQKAEQSDLLSDTVNYLEVYQVVKTQMEIKSNLLEHVARRIIQSLKQKYSAIDALQVKISKLNPPLGGQLEAVSVTISE